MNCRLTNEFECNLRSNELYLSSRGFGWTIKAAANQSQSIERQKTLASITMINDSRQNHRPRNIWISHMASLTKEYFVA